MNKLKISMTIMVVFIATISTFAQSNVVKINPTGKTLVWSSGYNYYLNGSTLATAGGKQRFWTKLDYNMDGNADRKYDAEWGSSKLNISGSNIVKIQISGWKKIGSKWSKETSNWITLDFTAYNARQNEIHRQKQAEKARQKKLVEESRQRQLEEERTINKRRIADAKNWDKGDKICLKSTLLFGNKVPIQAFIEDYNSNKTRFKVQIVKIDSNNNVKVDGVRIYRDAIIWIDITKNWWEKCN